MGTRARALVTSRFPLVDLDNWKGGGHREERLEDLEPQAARAVLRGWGVKGDDTTLEGLARRLHSHALSVAVLGSYLGKLWGGDPSKAPTFDRGEMAADDPKAARLSRILTSYAEKLPDAERDLLARLSTFPRGVTVELLGFLVEAGGQIAGALAACNQVRLLRLMERLRELGLVFRYDGKQGGTYTAHPFLRDYFCGLLGVARPQEIHESVRARLAPSLEARPTRPPTDPATLDRYEALIDHTRLAGRTLEAFDLYRQALGDYRHLGWVVGDNARGVRILAAFSPDGSMESAAVDLPAGCRSKLLCAWGLHAENLGDLRAARRAFTLAAELNRRCADSVNLSVDLQNQVGVELSAGRLPAAVEAAVAALKEAKRAGKRDQIQYAHAYLGASVGRLGNLAGARLHFAVAAEMEDAPQMYCLRGIWEAELKMAAGDRAGAASQTQANRTIATRMRWARTAAFCDTLLGLLSLPIDLAAARLRLDEARRYASHSGHAEVQLRCHRLAAEVARTERGADAARKEAEAGIHLAETCGFALHAIELRLALALAHLDSDDPTSALRRAEEALERSTDPECQYAWGEADALHLCGVAHARLGEIDLARQRLAAALARRESLTHPGAAETRAELERLGG
jgi:tetratricopeptide (TPR) repeat protein